MEERDRAGKSGAVLRRCLIGLAIAAGAGTALAAADGATIGLRTVAAYNRDYFGDRQGDAARGGRLVLQACAQCHGAQGNAISGAFPSLSGQLPGYVAAQLMLFKTGERRSPIMHAIAQNLSAGDMLDAAAYYAAQTPGAPYPSTEPALLARGATLFREGDPQRGIPACVHCHGATGSAIAPVFPRIGGQSPGYLEFVLGVLKTKHFVIHEAYVMKAILTNVTPEDIKAVSAYASTLTAGTPTPHHLTIH